MKIWTDQWWNPSVCVEGTVGYNLVCSTTYNSRPVCFLPSSVPHYVLFHFLAVLLAQEEPIRGFHVAEQLPFLKDLEKRHRKTVLSDMMNITKPWCCWKLPVKLLVLSSGHYDKPWSYWKVSVKLFVVFTLLWHENYHHILKLLKTVSEIKLLVVFASLWLEHHKI